MIDIPTQSEIVLRRAGYDTWIWSGSTPSTTCFENAALVGFIHVFDSGDDLLSRWKDTQQIALARHASLLRGAGAKAWNVYSIFLTPDDAKEKLRSIERIEEDFSLTRKIARAGIRTPSDLEHCLMSLTVVRAKPRLEDERFTDRLRNRLKEVPDEVMTAFLSDVDPDDIAQMLGETP